METSGINDLMSGFHFLVSMQLNITLFLCSTVGIHFCPVHMFGLLISGICACPLATGPYSFWSPSFILFKWHKYNLTIIYQWINYNIVKFSKLSLIVLVKDVNAKHEVKYYWTNQLDVIFSQTRHVLWYLQYQLVSYWYTIYFIIVSYLYYLNKLSRFQS